MFPISRQLNALAADSPPAEAAQASSSTAPPRVDALTRYEAAQALRSMDFLDDLMRHIVLQLIPTRPGWPPGAEIQLHVDGSPPPVRPPRDRCGPVHIMQCADGRYAALETCVRHAHWVHRGAPNSLFTALCDGLKCLDPTAFDNFKHAFVRETLGLRGGDAALRGGDAALLRHCLADQLERPCDLSESVLRALDAYGQQQAALRRARPELSGVPESHLRGEPAFPAFPLRLAEIRQAVPRRDGEANQDYARRLHEQWAGLGLNDLSRLSGAQEHRLRRDPAFQRLSAQLAGVRDAVPQEEGETGRDYARRLHAQQLGLSLNQLFLLSGAPASQLRGDPAFHALFAELAAVRDILPRWEGEANQAYAERLHEQRPDLGPNELSVLSGALVSQLRRLPAFLPGDLAGVRAAVPRRDGETDQDYGRRLIRQCGHQRGLSPNELSLISGAPESYLHRQQLAAIRDGLPRRDGETNQDYARRLHRARPDLRLSELSLLSGVPESQLAAIRDPVPRRDRETDQAYAFRLCRERPDLSLSELSVLSGVPESHLRGGPPLSLPAELFAIRDAMPRREGETDQAYTHRLREQWPGLTQTELSLLSGALAL
jgi:hypothetical protein